MVSVRWSPDGRELLRAAQQRESNANMADEQNMIAHARVRFTSYLACAHIHT